MRSVSNRLISVVVRGAAALLVAAGMSACAPTPPPATLPMELVGTQELVVGYRAQKKFEQYKKGGRPAYFAISEDGWATGWTNCRKGPDACTGANTGPRGALNYCRKAGGKNCMLFARGWDIIWQGPVRYADVDPDYRPPSGRAMPNTDPLLIPPPGKNKALKSMSLTEICAVAVDYSSRPYGWSVKPGAADYVAEARGRNLFIYQCAFETGHQ